METTASPSVLILCREMPPIGGGAGAVALALANEYISLGFGVHYVTMHYGSLMDEEVTESGIRVFRIRCGRKNQDSSYESEMLKFVIAAIPIVRRLCKTGNFSFIHAHSIVPEGLLALFARFWSEKARLIVTSHGSDVPGYNPDKFKLAHMLIRPLWQYVVRKFDVLTAPSNHQAKLIRRIRPEQEVFVVPNGVDPQVFEGVNLERDGSFLIVSRLVKRKNYHSFFEALKPISASVTVHVVGEGPTRPMLEEMAQELANHRIFFHGWLGHGATEWINLYRRCSFFVFPSINENFPMNLLEAQLAEMLVLASPIDPNKEVLGDHAVFFDGLNPDMMKAQIEEVLDSSNDYGMIIKAAKDRVVSSFSWRHIANQYVSLAIT